MLSICVFFVIVFRWWFFEWLIGTKLMYLADAILFTVAAAMLFADPTKLGSNLFAYFIGSCWIFIALYSSVRYVKLEMTKDDKNGIINK